MKTTDEIGKGGIVETIFAKEITAIGNALGLEGSFLNEFGFSQIMEKICPTPKPPEMEEIEVECYATVWPDKSICSLMVQLPEVMEESQNLVKLTGTYLRPVPQKVERSVSIDAEIQNGRHGYRAGTILDEFTDFPECHGKRGTLTFTWEE